MASESSDAAAPPPAAPKGEARLLCPDPAKAVKLVVRTLPPKLTEAEFRESISSWTDDIDYMRWEQGNVHEEQWKSIDYTVAYLRFPSREKAIAFSEEKDGAAYKDSTGGMTRCLVELAINQRVPNNRGKKDAREDTIEKDPDYIKFCEALNAEKPKPVSAEVLMLQREEEEKKKRKANDIIVTPLMAYIQQKRGARASLLAVALAHACATNRTCLPTPARQESMMPVFCPPRAHLAQSHLRSRAAF